MIKSFRHKGLQHFFETGSLAGIQPAHAERLSSQLVMLHKAKKPEDLASLAWHLHALTGRLKGHWAISVSGNWRLTFAFDGEDVILVNYCDYH
ncbi:peptidase [Duganella sp. FT135W]|uniref:Peptidase n=1 Tax=Duganella flavida TaxID=2692175 RepID=A0A6L8K3S9_9BURK|nr:type II toxin-antitoxin system RelE/ParE family toxin [Duganella flavida]MYM21187.1 peptidase [Duganella flavida]